MTVLLTVADSYANAEAGTEVSDALLGGGTGIDIGQVVNSSYAPVTSKAANTGSRGIYLAHDGTNEITDVKVYLDDYAIATGNTYGGARSSAVDYSEWKALGDSSGSSKNNADGLSGGVWIEFNSQKADGGATFFDQAADSTNVKIFGDNSTDGTDETTAFLFPVGAMISDAGLTAATTPVAGEIGPNGNLVLGDAAFVRIRAYVPDAYAEGGYFQLALTFLYSFTS